MKHFNYFLVATCHAKYCTRSRGSTTYCNKGNHTSSPFRSLHRRHGIVISVTAKFLSVLAVFCLCTLSRSHFSETRTLVMLHVQFQLLLNRTGILPLVSAPNSFNKKFFSCSFIESWRLDIGAILTP